jgi:outer membrane protein
MTGNANPKQLLVCLVAAMLFISFAFPAKAPAATTLETSAPATLTLQDAYRLALVHSESVAIEKEDIALARARFYRSFRYFLPDVHFVKTRMERDVDDDAASDGTGFSSDFRRRVTPESRFTFSQPLFSGFREFAALAGSGADRKTQVYDYQRAQELLFIDVMEAYYAVRQADKDVETLSSIRDLLSSRSKELTERTQLGRSRESELVTATSDWKLIEAELVGAQAAARTSRNLLEFYTGSPLKGRPLVDGDVPNEPLPPLDAAAKARTRLDVQSLEQAYRVRMKGVTTAQGGLFPTVSLDGNVYTERVGFQEGNDWDVLLTIDVPIFDAGETLGDIKEAASLRESARLAWERAKRSAEMDILNEYENFHSAVLSERALSDADAASKKNYEILTSEYRLNLVNNLDVLDSLRRYQDTIRSYNSARYDARRAYWRYQVARGEAL